MLKCVCFDCPQDPSPRHPASETPPLDNPPPHRPSTGPPKISRFFPSPARIFFLSSSLGGPFVVFWWCLKRRGPQMCMFGVLSCEAPAAQKPTGYHTTIQEPKRANFRVPTFKNTTEIQREDTQRDRKRTKWEGEREKKERNFGRSAGGGPAEGGRRGLASGGLAQGGPGASKPTSTTTTTTTTPTPPEVEGGGQTQNQCGVPSPGFEGLGLWGLDLLASENLAKTLKH